MEKYVTWAKENKGKAMMIAFVCFIVVAEVVKAVIA